MDSVYGERNPENCFSLGLDCQGCVEHSARTVAAVCRGMNIASVYSVFVQLYPSPGCARMQHAFATAYVEGTTPRKAPLRAIAAA